ncbi:MAG: HDIG domain-containing protein, partial [Phycisphaerae bacterium]|nr:HDIG domain-containing protein [Phycisphaerae bacterium]
RRRRTRDKAALPRRPIKDGDRLTTAMWWIRKTSRRRRLEGRRGPPAGEPSAWGRFRAAGGLGSAALAVAFFAAVLLMDLWPTDPLPYRLGQYVPADIHARVDFEVLSQRLLAEDLDRARTSTPTTFQLNVTLVDEILSRLQALPAELSATSHPALDGDPLKPFAIEGEPALAAWRAMTQPARQESYTQHLQRLQDALAEVLLVRQEDLEHSSGKVYLVRPGGGLERHVSDLISLNKTDRVAHEVGRVVGVLPPALQDNVRSYLLDLFSRGRPLYRFNKEATENDIKARQAAIQADPPKEHYEQGRVLVRASRAAEGGGMAGLSESDLNLLVAESQAYLAAQRRDRPWTPWLRRAGRALALLLLCALLVAYVARQQPQVVKDHGRGFVLTALLLLMLALAKVMAISLGWNWHVVVLPVLMAAVVVTIAYEQRLAFVLGAILAVLVVFQLRAGLALLLVLLSAILAVVFLLHEIRRRSRLIEVSAVAGVLALVAVWAGGLAQAVPWPFVLTDSLWAAGAALLVGFLVQGLLPLVERWFGVATSLTLLEWCDASQPLLKRLATEAPGTYNHSLQLGTMCEAAAESIGARGLLARVGAYYHDAGKINKPDYFGENQASATSKHARLSPAMSLLIILGHVKDGLELARQYGLPPVLYEFITSHHGTTLLQIFFEAAAQQRKAADQRAPEEVEFRYPGPKPHSKECAILMLADAAESSVRSMSEPTPGRIENQVHTMVNRRLMDGQLDECELTLKEVHQIEATLTKSLCSIYHSRVSYPTPKGDRPSAAELQAARRKNDKGDEGKKAEKAEAPQIELHAPQTPLSPQIDDV